MKQEKIPRKVYVNPIFNDRAVVLKTNDDTGGVYSLGELMVYPGGANFPHTHSAFEETFTAVKGELGVMLGDQKHILHPGESITVPQHKSHYFFNEGKEPATCHIKFVPGHDDFVKGIAIMYGLAADGKTNKIGVPKSITHLAIFMELTDTKPDSKLVTFCYPFFKWLAKKARKNGTEQALLDKYYYEAV